MIIPDINLLLYAHDSASPWHLQCRNWWEKCLSGTESVGLPEVVMFGFLRIITNPKVFASPLSVTKAVALVQSWLDQPNCDILSSAPGRHEKVFELLERVGTAGNLVSDAQIAAAVIEHGAVLHTSDTDFMRFSDLTWFNPITGMGSHSARKT